MKHPGQGRRVVVAVILGALSAGWTAAAQTAPGEALFQSSCAACHTIGGGRLVGPDLQGVGERRSEAWLIGFIQHSQQLVAAGDSTAVALFNEYEEMPMPDQPLSADEIRQVLGYIRGAAPTGAARDTAVAPASEEQILLGGRLFQGTAHLANGGVPCTSCHDVTGGAITGGGGLARELTTAFSRLGAPGLQAVIANPPFPVMQRAYRDHPLTDAEVAALVGFLGRVAEQPAAPPVRGFDLRLFVMGVGGSVVLLVLYALIWRRRLKGSVNQQIYDRQIGTT
jgi:mono/diheme cytochrome c family protein